MTTYLELQTLVSRKLRDTSNNTFTVAIVKDLINAAITEVSRIAPQPYQEDLTPDGSLSYQLNTSAPSRRISLSRVEIWDASPARFRVRVAFAGESLVNSSEAGWRTHNGYLELPYSYGTFAADSTFTIRVWGTKPWSALSADGDVTDLDEDAQDAMVECAVFHGYESLLNDRVLFKQYQTQSNNTDVSLGQLMSSVALWQARWDRRRKLLAEMRELP